MISMEYSSIWWQQITGPFKLYNEIVDNLALNQSIVLIKTSDQFYIEKLRYLVEHHFESLKQEFLLIDGITLTEYNTTEDFLFAKFKFIQKPSIETFKMSSIEKLGKSGILSKRTFWFYNLTPDHESKLLKFINDFTKKYNDVRFVVEISTENKIVSNDKMKKFEFSEYITQMDTMIFVYHLMANKNANQIQYATQLISNICGINSEIAASMSDKYDACKHDPIDILKSLRDSFIVDKHSGTFTDSNKVHPLNLVQSNLQKIHRLIWKSQVQIIFPMLELARQEIIERHLSKIKENLKYHTNLEQKDVFALELIEIRIICIDSNARKDKILNDIEINRLSRMIYARNELAHLRVLDFKVANEIFSILK